MNARFWTYANGSPVKLTLHDGQSLSWGRSGPTDEGWSSEWNRYSLSGVMLRLEYESDGSGCDGRLSSGGTTVTTLDKLTSGFRDDDEVVFPEWEHEDDHRRDYQAEDAGY